ncbi:MAG: hypothetical protein ACRDCA_27110 [Serratia sp. (in: enterobacteria)]|uniref:hypothetical protein n=1 Tax=Serratia sp. (in: enterobacteria) TaxID=616 RepID=UPI003F2C2FEF
MNNKEISLLPILICITALITLCIVMLKDSNSGLSCEAETYYKWHFPAPGKTVNRYIAIHLEKINNAGEGKGRISFTSIIYYEKKTYYLRRDILVNYQVSNDKLYFFKTLYINKDPRDSISEEMEKKLVPEILYKVGNLSSFTILKAGNGYFFSLTDTPLFYCNRL